MSLDPSTRQLPSPTVALEQLLGGPLRKFGDMPDAIGLYGLGDHFGQIHYIGMTDSHSFRDRIWIRHITGSEERSHKLACNYSVGRLRHDRRHPDVRADDGAIARSVRQAFIRKHCRFVCLPLRISKQELKTLEDAVIDLAGPRASWNHTRKRVATFDEPRDLVDVVIGEMGLSSAQIAALDRQDRIFRSL